MATAHFHRRRSVSNLMSYVGLLLAGCLGGGADKSQREAIAAAANTSQSADLQRSAAEPATASSKAQLRGPIQCARKITANVVALDQALVFNRFDAIDPAGMIYALERDVRPLDSSKPIGPGNVILRGDKRPRPLVLRANVGDCLIVNLTNYLTPYPHPSFSSGGSLEHSPATREVSFHVDGLPYANGIADDGAHVGLNSDSTIPVGGSYSYAFYAEKEGGYFAYSMGASFGGEGNGGSTVHGLFASVNVEPPGSRWYRSQVTGKQLDSAITGQVADPALSNPPIINYAATSSAGQPVLDMLDANNEIVASDLTAIIDGFSTTEVNTPGSLQPSEGQFREFTILFHDELHAIQAFDELDTLPEYHSVRDGFAINYGSAGLGAEVLANRARIGPTKDCVECKYEEFFLESWAGGDPSMIVEKDQNKVATQAKYPDDPSNVYHSYLGDPIRFRNIHAGPKETHVFHLHAHQWLYSPANDKSSYLDSQTIGPGGSYTYSINYNAGNKNFTVGDSIFHCHLYPHFAQGMWALWRNHDVLELGTKDRKLPDAEIVGGTPNPAVVPLPRKGMAPMPTYADTRARPAMPGYPFYIAAKAGHRSPQPPLDIRHNGGLQRHLITGVSAATYGAAGSIDRFKVILDQADIKLLPETGTIEEVKAMNFHAGAFPGATPQVSPYGWAGAAYPTYTSSGTPSTFMVNGKEPIAGAPFADPCPTSAKTRKYSAAYIEKDIVVNKAGWHDPQARFMVLKNDVADTMSGARPPEPFFFRARSGECIEFEATNLIPGILKGDDFQLTAPTDIIGQHIHLVKFDVTASDGAGNGWNYEDGTFSPDEVAERIHAANNAGGAFPEDGTIDPVGTRQPLTLAINPLYGIKGAQTTVQRWYADPTLDWNGNDLTLRTVFTHDHFGPSNHQQHGFYGALVVEPANSTWRNSATGVALGTRLDDGGPTSWQAIVTAPAPRGRTGINYREFNLAFADFAIVYDALGQPVNPPTQHEASLPMAVRHDAADTCGAASCPEAVSAGDPGGGLINYRNEPIPHRIAEQSAGGSWGLKSTNEAVLSNVFSSAVHGDPFTPVLKAYAADKLQINLIQGAQEEQHVFTLAGHKWNYEPGDEDTGFANGRAIGISEHSEFILSRGIEPTRTTDFLYSSAPTDDLWNGMWGLLRIYAFRGVTPDIGPKETPLLGSNKGAIALDDTTTSPAELESNPRPVEKTIDIKEAERVGFGTEPGVSGGQDQTIDTSRSIFPIFPSCPTFFDPLKGFPKVRRYDVHAILADRLPGGRLVYNAKYGLYDPDAILYVEGSKLKEVIKGARQPEPLILRAAAGECIEVTLYNDLPLDIDTRNFTAHWNFNPPITEGFNTNQTRFAARVGLQPQMVAFDSRINDGARVGYNRDSTVAPGQKKTYVWYAGTVDPKVKFGFRPVEFGVVNLKDLADVVNHGMHGGGGVLVVEPANASWTESLEQSAQAVVTYVTVENGQEVKRSFNELVLIYQDEVALHSEKFSADPSQNNNTFVIHNNAAVDDAEDTGHKAFNYKTEPLWARLGLKPETSLEDLNRQQLTHLLASSAGDPETPLFTVASGSDVRIRIAQFSGHNRQHGFTWFGHQWQRQPWATGSRSGVMGHNVVSSYVATQDGIGPMCTWNALPLHGAGANSGSPGDYLYRDMPSFMYADGAWGVVRVK
jgi:manganese oxidase